MFVRVSICIGSDIPVTPTATAPTIHVASVELLNPVHATFMAKQW